MGFKDHFDKFKRGASKLRGKIKKAVNPSDEDLAEDLQRLREKRIKVEGHAKLLELREKERARIQKAKGQGGGGKFISHVDKFARGYAKATKQSGGDPLAGFNSFGGAPPPKQTPTRKKKRKKKKQRQQAKAVQDPIGPFGGSFF